MRALGLIVLAACAGRTAKPAPPFDPFATDPLAVLASLEDRLVSATQVDVTLEAHTLGAMTIELTGELHVEPQRVSWIKLRGKQDGAPVTAKWSSLTPFEPSRKDTQSPTWADGLLIGLTRMGAMHNLAAVTSQEDPETGNGDIRSWVTVVGDVAWKDGDPGTRTLAFTIDVISGSEAAVELVLDDRGLPLRREMTVHFDEGDVRMIESYAKFDVSP